jgi:soluble lytic murein transglycosylase
MGKRWQVVVVGLMVSGAVRADSRDLLEEAKAELADLQSARDRGVLAAVQQAGLPDRLARRVATAIVREARRVQLDPLLIVAVIRAESSFNPQAKSPVGAIGLMQVMPDTGRFWAKSRGGELKRTSYLYDPELNIELGASYLADLVRRFGSVEGALVAYNAGPGKARRILLDRQARQRFVAGYPTKVASLYRELQASQPARTASAAPAVVHAATATGSM